MAIELKDLIESIKNEGIRTGENQAIEITKEANLKREQILKEAQKEADAIIANAKAQAEKEQMASDAAIKQASRNLILNTKKEIQNIFSKIIETEVSKSLTADLLKDAILSVVKGIGEDRSNLQVLVGEAQLKKVEAALLSSLASEVKAGLEIKVFPNLDAGFRVGLKDGSAFYDFSDTEIALMLSQYLNQKLASLLTSE